jgi:indole-3-glycerol phosphate synthase
MILDEIAAKTVLRVAERKQLISAEEIVAAARLLPADTGFPFEQALKSPDISFICELKKASPSAGVLSADFPYLEIARQYEAAGAAALSVLTEPYFFQGSDEVLRQIVEHVRLPVLRKDFTIDAYQIYEAKCLGASAVLLICALLDTSTIARFLAIADQLGLSALVEAHSASEVRSAVQAGARLIGVNNRDLQTFQVDLKTSMSLRRLVPDHILFVSESGIRTAEDVAMLRDAGADGILIGETLMRSPDIGQQLSMLRSASRNPDSGRQPLVSGGETNGED